MTTVKHLGGGSASLDTVRQAIVGGANVYLSVDSTIPYYVQIAQQLTYLIYSRQLKPGGSLPSVRSFASALGVTSNTVSQAYAELQSTGLAVAIKGSGTYVRPDAFNQDEDWHLRNELASEAVTAVRRRIHSLGLDDEDLQRHVMGLAHGPERPCEIAFAAPSIDSAGKFARSIDADLGQMGVSATPLSFEALSTPAPETRAVLERVYYVVTFVSTRSTVTKLLEPFGRRHRVLGISIELVDETVASLQELDPHLNVLIVTTERYFDIALNVVQSNSRLGAKNIHRLTVDAGPVELATRAADADLVIHTFGASEVVDALGLSAEKRLLIGFRIDTPSRQNLAEILRPGRTR